MAFHETILWTCNLSFAFRAVAVGIGSSGLLDQIRYPPLPPAVPPRDSLTPDRGGSALQYCVLMHNKLEF